VVLSRASLRRDVRITNNRIATARVGIRLVGGTFSTSRGNSVTCVRLAGNSSQASLPVSIM
jgi:hypothetical protein